ncbi:hypothetical protein FNU76_12435 [Chitinimonas arctica]|uniref:Uncharacterized protein n=1 Tax=Chitinimonas arctica TaxID=2594795 RepID=A0A516SG14_9NEIS|nr:hypothetical protein [Chitinimonas arctica]QDQ27104.1 hypothetical protein FNU76_12435 [Chitinimonas arctica]
MSMYVPCLSGRAATPTSLRRTIRAAQWCGLLPMLGGSLILGGWVYSAANFLPLIGLLNVLLGFALFGAGAGLIYAAYLRAGRRRVPGAGLAIVLLMANFPLALLFGGVAAQVEEQRLQAAACVPAATLQHAEPTGLADARRRPC